MFKTLLRMTLLMLCLAPGVAHAGDAPMTIATGVDPGFAPFYVGVKAGIFQKHGLDVILKTGPSGGAMVPLVIGHQVNAALAAAFAGLNNHLVDPDLVAVMQVTAYDHWYGIVARDSIKTVAELKGHKIGITKGTASEALWRATLAHYKLSPAAFAPGLVNVEAPEMLAAIERGDIDAFVNWEPWISRTIQNVPGTHLLTDNYGILRDVAFVYMDRKWIAQNHHTAVEFAKSLIDAVAFIRSNPADTRKIVGDMLNLSPPLMNAMLPKLSFAAKLDRESYEVAKVQVEQLKSSGRLNGNFDYSRFFETDLLKAAAPSLVALPPQM